jgi:hypothetical protein
MGFPTSFTVFFLVVLGPLFEANAAMLTSGNPNPPWGGTVCADVAGANANTGTKVQSWPCHAGPNQQFAFEGQQIFAMGGTMCVDVSGAKTSPGTTVGIWSCNRTVAQNWQYTNLGQIMYINGNLCLDATTQASGTQLIVNTCAIGQDGLPVTSQSWQIK